jgi:hypothetical protein
MFIGADTKAGQTGPIFAAHAWRTNAELIADMARLGYLSDEWRTLDPTYGRGICWNKRRPTELVTHDLAIDGVDLRHLPHAEDSFDAAVFGPPYVSVGGRRMSTIPDFLDRFGLGAVPTTPLPLQAMNDQGLAELARVVRPGGYVLTKCTDYITASSLLARTAR